MFSGAGFQYGIEMYGQYEKSGVEGYLSAFQGNAVLVSMRQVLYVFTVSEMGSTAVDDAFLKELIRSVLFKQFHQCRCKPVFICFDKCIEGTIYLMSEFIDASDRIFERFHMFIFCITFYFL